MDKKAFGSFIKEKRTEKRLTQKELANSLMIDVTAVSKWERGVSYPDITLIPDICKNLDVSEKELIESSNDTEYRHIKNEAQKYKKLKDSIFYSLSSCYFVAVLTCFIVNLAVEYTLSWFFIVFSGCLCGFCFIPGVTRFAEKARFSLYIGSTLLSLAVLYLTCSIYTRNYWCFIAITGTVLGYFMICFPIIFAKQKAYFLEEEYKKIKRFFLISYMAGIYIFTTIMLLTVSAYTKTGFLYGYKIFTGCFWILLVFGIIRMSNLHIFTRLGIDFLIMSVYYLFLNGFLNYMLGSDYQGCYKINFNNWNTYTNGNVCFIIVLSSLALSVIFFVLSIIIRRKLKKDKILLPFQV